MWNSLLANLQRFQPVAVETIQDSGDANATSSLLLNQVAVLGYVSTKGKPVTGLEIVSIDIHNEISHVSNLMELNYCIVRFDTIFKETLYLQMQLENDPKKIVTTV